MRALPIAAPTSRPDGGRAVAGAHGQDPRRRARRRHRGAPRGHEPHLEGTPRRQLAEVHAAFVSDGDRARRTLSFGAAAPPPPPLADVTNVIASDPSTWPREPGCKMPSFVSAYSLPRMTTVKDLADVYFHATPSIKDLNAAYGSAVRRSCKKTGYPWYGEKTRGDAKAFEKSFGKYKAIWDYLEENGEGEVQDLQDRITIMYPTAKKPTTGQLHALSRTLRDARDPARAAKNRKRGLAAGATRRAKKCAPADPPPHPYFPPE